MKKIQRESKESERISDKKKISARKAVSETTNKWMARNKSLVLRQTPFWAQSLAGVVIGLGVIAVSAGILFRIDEVVSVSGQLVALGGSVSVKTPAGGKISEVYFSDGELVRKGEALVKFDTRQAASNKKTSSRLIELEKIDLKERIGILNGQKNVLERKIETTKSITESMEKLVIQGGIEKIQYLQQLDALYELQSQLSSLKLEFNRTRLESEKSIGQLENQLKESELQLQYQNVEAPATGIVFESKASVDGVIGAGDTILTIIPQGGLKAKVFVANKDIGFVKKRQKAKIRVDAFPFTQYGELEGEVKQIGADALPPDETASIYRYPVSLDLNKPYLESKGVKIPLRSGMAVTANLKLRDKRLISLLSDMLVDQTESIRSIRQQ